jgi:gliding motility-associated-like protein
LYSVIISQNACDYSDEILVEYNPLESIDLGPDQSICLDDFIVLDATFPGATYEWQDDSDLPTFEVLTDGTYSVIVTLENCTAEDSIEINPVEAVSLDLGEDFSICEGESAEISTDIAADSYEWNTSEDTQMITVSNAGEYTLEISVDDCIYTASVVMEVSPNPSFSLGSDIDLCDGETTILDTSSEPGSYEWQDGSLNATYEVDQSGVYSVTVTLGNCTGSDEVEVFYYPNPEFDLGEDVVVCYSSGFQLEVDTEVDDVTIVWNTGQSSAVITPNSSGTYEATTYANGCSHLDAVNVELIPALYVDLGFDRIMCKGEVLPLFADVQDFNYPLTFNWSEQGTQQMLEVTDTGLYEVTVESECDVVSDEIDVYFEQCGCFVYVPNAFTPDLDGLNDYFAVETECQFQDFILQIFNRDGELIFYSEDPSQIWDGSHQNGEYFVPNGVYVYRIEYTSATLEGIISEVLSGHLTLMR